MRFEHADAIKVDAIRSTLLGQDLANQLRSSGESFFFPVEDLIENQVYDFSVVEYTGPSPGTEEQRVRPYFQLVVNGTIPLAEYLHAETHLLAFTRLIWDASYGRTTVQVQSTALRRKANNIIDVDDLDTVSLLMQLGLREVAMNTFAFPLVGVFLTNHWDARLLAFSADRNAKGLLLRLVAESGLAIRSLTSSRPST